MSDVGEHFIKPLLLQFILPNTAKEGQEAAFYQDYQEALSDFTSHELEHAAKLLKTTRTSRTFPVIADCLEAARQARDALQPPVKKRQQERGTPPEWTDERQREAGRLICCEMGRQAADEGWLIALWDFCRKNERRPNKFEAEKIAAYSKGTWAYVEDAEKEMIARGQDVSPVVKWRKTMQKRFRWLSEKVNSKTEAA